jgi:enoyl-CoA hydratase
MTSPYSTLRLDIGDGVAEIHLARPDLLNRFDMPAHKEFVSALRVVRARKDALRALILAADGRAFSAGGDFDEILDAHAHASLRDDMATHAKEVFNGLSQMEIPVIAAVQGAAIGLGATIATLCDIVVAWREAKIADTHVNVGIVAGDGGIVSWSQSIGINRAKRYLLTGDIMTAEQAHHYGLVTELVERPEDTLPRARELAGKIKAMAPMGVNGTKQAFARITAARTAEAFEFGLHQEMLSIAAPEVPGIIAALRKR